MHGLDCSWSKWFLLASNSTKSSCTSRLFKKHGSPVAEPHSCIHCHASDFPLMSPRGTHTPHNRWLGSGISLPGPALWNQCKPNYSFSSQRGQNSSSGASSPLHYHIELVAAILSTSLTALALPALDTGYGFAILKGIVPWRSCYVSAGSEFPSQSASPAMGCPQDHCLPKHTHLPQFIPRAPISHVPTLDVCSLWYPSHSSCQPLWPYSFSILP